MNSAAQLNLIRFPAIAAGLLMIVVSGHADAMVPFASSPSARAVEPRIYQVEELDDAPKAIRQAKPGYPYQVTEGHISATVDIAFVVDSTGRVVGARARECKILTSGRGIDFDTYGRGVNSRTHKSAINEFDYGVLREVARKFIASAVQGVSAWTFRPGKMGGRPVDSVVAVEIKYAHDVDVPATYTLFPDPGAGVPDGSPGRTIMLRATDRTGVFFPRL